LQREKSGLTDVDLLGGLLLGIAKRERTQDKAIRPMEMLGIASMNETCPREVQSMKLKYERRKKCYKPYKPYHHNAL
jgi:hypothetical protein